MKIFAKEFRKFHNISEKYNEKGNPILENTYLVFGDNKGYAYFGSKEGLGRFQFFFEKEANEQIPNFFINTFKLNSIICQYDDIMLNDKLVFSNGKDKFRVSTLIDEEQYNTNVFNNEYKDKLVLNKDNLEKIAKALSFVNKDDENFKYVYIKDKCICGMMQKTPMYETFCDIDDELALPYGMVKTILQVGGIENECTIYYDSELTSKKIVSDDLLLEVIVPNNSTTEFPQIREPSFIESYAYSDFIKVDTALLAKTLTSLQAYFNDVMNAKINIIVGDDLTLAVEDKNTNVERHMPYLEITEIQGQEYYISGSKLLQALSVLKEKELYISVPLSDGGPIVNLYNNDLSHCLITRFVNA